MTRPSTQEEESRGVQCCQPDSWALDLEDVREYNYSITRNTTRFDSKIWEKGNCVTCYLYISVSTSRETKKINLLRETNRKKFHINEGWDVSDLVRSTLKPVFRSTVRKKTRLRFTVIYSTFGQRNTSALTTTPWKSGKCIGGGNFLK